MYGNHLATTQQCFHLSLTTRSMLAAIKSTPAYLRIFINYARHRISGRRYEFVASTFFGSRIAGNTADLIPRKLFLFGIWEPNITHWVREQLSPGDTFVDVGANLGYYSLLASKLVGNIGKVVAIEASPRNAYQLRRNLALNQTPNVRIVQAAASDKTGALSLYHGPAGKPGDTSIVFREGFTYECEVTAAQLCEILSSSEISTARIIKIDVEGAEWSVIAGLLPCLNLTRPDMELVLEINPHDLVTLGRRAENLIARLTDAGFCAYTIKNEYPSRRYVPPLRLARPQRLNGPVTQLTDMIFSRRDAASL